LPRTQPPELVTSIQQPFEEVDDVIDPLAGLSSGSTVTTVRTTLVTNDANEDWLDPGYSATEGSSTLMVRHDTIDDGKARYGG